MLAKTNDSPADDRGGEKAENARRVFISFAANDDFMTNIVISRDVVHVWLCVLKVF
jgi:hypothetical protein